jgi:hypothetical protein
LVLPVYSLASSTRKLPVVVGAPKVAASDVAGTASAALVFCTNLGPVGATVTVNSNVAECVPDAAEPVTVIVDNPATAPDVAATVIADDPPADTDPGLNDTVTPAGIPDADNATDCTFPLVTAASEKSYGGGTALNSAIADAQYIEVGNEATRRCGDAEVVAA